MKTSTLLRIASVVTFLYFAGHTAGMPWTPGEGPAELAVIEAMKSNRFAATGSSRTYWDFYFGFEVSSVSCNWCKLSCYGSLAR